MKAAWIASSGFLIVAGLWFASMELILRHSGFAVRAAVAVLVVIHGALTLWLTGHRGSAPLRRTVLCGGFLATALGAWAVATEFRATDFEGYILLFGLGLLTQGLLTLALTPGTDRLRTA